MEQGEVDRFPHMWGYHVAKRILLYSCNVCHNAGRAICFVRAFFICGELLHIIRNYIFYIKEE